MRANAAERLTEIVGTAQDPLQTVIEIASDTTQDPQLRLGAASIALPYLYPRLSATTVASTHTVARLDASDLLQRLNERMARVAGPTIGAAPVDPGREAA